MLPLNNTSASAYLNVKIRDLIAVFQKMDSVEKKEGYSSWRGTAFLDI
jgi:hypothetical protein